MTPEDTENGGERIEFECLEPVLPGPEREMAREVADTVAVAEGKIVHQRMQAGCVELYEDMGAMTVLGYDSGTYVVFQTGSGLADVWRTSKTVEDDEQACDLAHRVAGELNEEVRSE